MSKIGYMCGLDFLCHIESDGAQLYGSIKSLKKARSCWIQCGIVKVEVNIKKWVKKQDYRSTK